MVPSARSVEACRVYVMYAETRVLELRVKVCSLHMEQMLTSSSLSVSVCVFPYLLQCRVSLVTLRVGCVPHVDIAPVISSY
jgi:hypothetical protein